MLCQIRFWRATGGMRRLFISMKKLDKNNRYKIHVTKNL